MRPGFPLALAPAVLAVGCGAGSGADPAATPPASTQRTAIAAAPIAATTTAGTQTAGTQTADAQTPGTDRAVIVCDAAVSYPNLAAVRRAATTVVLIKPTGVRTIRSLGGVPFTVSTVAVLLHLSGERLRPLFGLRQTGGPRIELEGACPPLVSERDLYLAFVTPFRLRADGPAVRGQYSAIALYRHAGPSVPEDSAPAFARLGDVPLPDRISIAQARTS
jgi:hypothetical protein